MKPALGNAIIFLAVVMFGVVVLSTGACDRGGACSNSSCSESGCNKQVTVPDSGSSQYDREVTWVVTDEKGKVIQTSGTTVNPAGVKTNKKPISKGGEGGGGCSDGS